MHFLLHTCRGTFSPSGNRSNHFEGLNQSRPLVAAGASTPQPSHLQYIIYLFFLKFGYLIGCFPCFSFPSALPPPLRSPAFAKQFVVRDKVCLVQIFGTKKS